MHGARTDREPRWRALRAVDAAVVKAAAEDVEELERVGELYRVAINTRDKTVTGWPTWGGNAQRTGIQR